LNPVQLPMEKKVRAVRWIPQGWSFFTRNPREEQLSYFIREPSGRWRAASLGPVSHPRNALGLNRKSRAQGVESAFLLAAVPNPAWVSCGDEEPEHCLDRLPVRRRVRTHSRKPTLTGIVGFVKHEPVPWAWFASGKKVTMPSRAVVVRVE
jgi:antimicrobial peptide system SdpA family protein